MLHLLHDFKSQKSVLAMSNKYIVLKILLLNCLNVNHIIIDITVFSLCNVPSQRTKDFFGEQKSSKVNISGVDASLQSIWWRSSQTSQHNAKSMLQSSRSRYCRTVYRINVIKKNTIPKIVSLLLLCMV